VVHLLKAVSFFPEEARKKAREVVLCFLLIFIPMLAGAQSSAELPAAEGSAAELNMEDLRRRILRETPEELMSYSLGDSEVSLFITGSWKGELQGNLGYFFSPLGNGFISPETLLLFKQEVDLTLSLWINDRWFLEASFLDDSSQNTYRAGYQGFKGEFVQYAGIGNTGLDFPSFPYLDLGGDSPSSFGFYSRFDVSDVNIHALVRYDAASREERVFSGSREMTYTDTQPPNSIRGVSFVLPDENIDSDIIVYIEDDKGTITDDDGRRWRLALGSEYAASRTQGLLELNIRPSGMVAVSYSKNGDRPWENSMGSYDGAPNGFLTDVQNWFGPDILLSSYPQCGNARGTNTRPGVVIFNTTFALVIYQNGAFSPFERRSHYDAPSSTSERAAIIQLSSGKEITGYELVRIEKNASIDMPLYSTSVSQRAVYELVKTNGFVNQRDPAARWPLAQNYPEIYLTGNVIFPGDITIRFTNYNSNGGFFIGTDAIPGSIQVFRSGIQDTNFNYNSVSGEVTIQGSAGQNEIIRITYLKRSEGTRFGSIAAGIGAVYENSVNPFSAQAAVGIRWNVTDDSFTEENFSSAGTVGISAKTAWDYDYLKANIKAAFTFVQTDTTGLYRAAGMEGYENIMSLSSELSFISNSPFTEFSPYTLTGINRAGLIYRNYYNNSVLGSNLMPVDWNGNVIVSGIQRPYPVRDPYLGDVQVMAGEFYLDASEYWTGFQIPLGSSSEIISRAAEIEIPFRLYNFSGDLDAANFKLIIQIGSLSGRDFQFLENSALVWEEQLFPSGLNFDENAHIAKFTLDEIDRQKLTDAKFLRIIAVYEGSADIRGRILLAPPIIRGAAFRPVTVDNEVVNGTTNKVRAAETRETGSSSLESTYGSLVNRLHTESSTQRVLEIKWEDMLLSGIGAGVDGRLSRIPLSDYKELSFFVKGPAPQNSDGILRFIIAPGPESILNPELEARIPLSAFSQDAWRKVTIRYQGGNTGITVDGGNASGSALIYKPLAASIDNSGKTSYIAVLIENESAPLAAGTLYIDEIILEDAVLVYRVNAGAGLEYSRDGTLLSAWNIPVFADLKFYTALESEGRSGIELFDSSFTGSLASRTSLGVSVLGADISGNFSFTLAEDDFSWSADHSISKSIGAFSFRESFFASPQSNTARHILNLSFLSNFHARFYADALYDLSRLQQKWNIGLGYRPRNTLIPSISINTEAAWTRQKNINENDNYGELWINSFSPLVPDAGSAADTRKAQAQIIITQRTRPVGAVLTLDGNTNITSANKLTRTESSGFLDIPIAVERTNINFRIGRKFTRELFFYGQDAFEDGNKFLENLEDSASLWSVFPFYSLFADDTKSAMDKMLENSSSANIAQYSLFNDHVSLRINLPGIYNLSAFFIPSRITLRVERILEQKLETGTDSLNLGGSLGFSAINAFGAMGHTPVFKFYQSDEFSHAAEAAVIIPKNEELSWRVNSVLSAGFRGYSSGVFNFINNLTIRSGGYWLESFTAFWEAPSEKSIIGSLYKWISSSLEKLSSWNNLSSILHTRYEQLRKESIEITFDKSTDYLRWSVTAGHEGIVRIMGRLNFTAFVKLRFSEDTYTDVFIIDAKIGTTLRIIF